MGYWSSSRDPNCRSYPNLGRNRRNAGIRWPTPSISQVANLPILVMQEHVLDGFKQTEKSTEKRCQSWIRDSCWLKYMLKLYNELDESIATKNKGPNGNKLNAAYCKIKKGRQAALMWIMQAAPLQFFCTTLTDKFNCRDKALDCLDHEMQPLRWWSTTPYIGDNQERMRNKYRHNFGTWMARNCCAS